jgi:hypothetical protein
MCITLACIKIEYRSDFYTVIYEILPRTRVRGRVTIIGIMHLEIGLEKEF